jgi:hypothetical protein
MSRETSNSKSQSILDNKLISDSKKDNIVEANNMSTNYYFSIEDSLINNSIEDKEYDSIRRIQNALKGDDTSQKDNNQLRILFQNVNSLRPQNQEKWKSSI